MFCNIKYKNGQKLSFFQSHYTYFKECKGFKGENLTVKVFVIVIITLKLSLVGVSVTETLQKVQMFP